jgi:hypothetical protein
MRNPLCLAVLLLVGCTPLHAQAQPCETDIKSYLYEPSYCMDNVLRGKPVEYVPRPGDVMLATDKNLFWKITHDMAFAFEPHNSALVVARHDGRLGLLEAGPNDTRCVDISDMLPHLKRYSDKGPVWIRKRKTPPTPEQSACLTEWAERQVGKRFALVRLGGQLTVLRSRGPLRTQYLGKMHGERNGYFCSELVLEALAAVDLVDRVTVRPSATYPHELFYDQSYNHYLRKHLPLVCDWEPPARWMPCID